MLELLLAMSIAANRLTEIVKQALIDRWNISEDARNTLTLVISMLFGVLGAFAASANMFAGNPTYGRMPEVVGIVLTGMIAGGGSNVIHGAFGLLNVASLLPAKPADPPAAG